MKNESPTGQDEVVFPEKTWAVVFDAPQDLVVRPLTLTPPTEHDVVVEVRWSGISTGTERLLWSGTMPMFPGMGYPLVPGYESVGRVIQAGPLSERSVGETVFVPGASCYGDVRGLFGGSARYVVLPGARTVVVDSGLGEQAILLALAATAHHAIGDAQARAKAAEGPVLVVGHGVLGRLLARLLTLYSDTPPVVWERNAGRAKGAEGYTVLDPAQDETRNYHTIYDVSGDASVIDLLIGRLAPKGEIVLAGFYTDRPSFDFAPAFMREARLRIAAEWTPEDMLAVREEVEAGRLGLDGLITHHSSISKASDAYDTAFNNPDCLKMILDWSTLT